MIFQSVMQMLAFPTLLIHVMILLYGLTFLIPRLQHTRTYKIIIKILQMYYYYIIFVLTFTSALGSLFLSEIVKFPPCNLCWYQRIVMYPQVVLSYLAIMRDETINPYLLSLSIIGAGIALFHYVSQLLPSARVLSCEAIGGVSCYEGYSYYFGYISIPLMAFTVFISIILLIDIAERATKRQDKQR